MLTDLLRLFAVVANAVLIVGLALIMAVAFLPRRNDLRGG